MSEWKRSLMDLKYKHGKINHSDRDELDYLIKEKEVGLKHDEAGSIIKLSDDGCIDIFAGDEVGIRLDPNTRTINFFADHLNIFSGEVRMRTAPYGVSWNGKTLDPNEIALKGIERPVPETKFRYSEEIIDMMKDLGLPVKKVESGEANG